VTIEQFLRGEADLGSFAGASWAIGSSSGIDQTGAVGNAVSVPLRLPATVDTIYDCASLTKPLVTTTIALDEFSLDHEIHGYTVRQLLTHTSGLRAWMPLYAYDDPIRAILEEGPECERGTRVIYSDLNFILLWNAIEDFDAKARALGARIKPDPSLKPRIAATEWGQRWEMKMCAEFSVIPSVSEGSGGTGGARPPRSLAHARDDTFPFRDTLIWGETHDGNSHHIGNGCAGNAGLFATAREVFELTRAAIRGREIKSEVEGRGLGWDIATGSEATSMLSPGSFGHTGFTGTSVWVDRARDLILVLLTNRVHPCAAPIAIQRIRGEFHRIAIESFRS
jgi:CubicO group peptidase (beta-lactamase class C family)